MKLNLKSCRMFFIKHLRKKYLKNFTRKIIQKIKKSQEVETFSKLFQITVKNILRNWDKVQKFLVKLN